MAEAPTAQVARLLDLALALRGTRYLLGGDSPATGFDCSGFVRYALGRHAIGLPRTVDEQYASGHPIAIDEMQTGDLVFFAIDGRAPTHVGIVIDPQVERTFVHAPNQQGAVRVERFDTSYWQARLVGARRVF